MGLLDIFSSSPSGGLLQSQQAAYGIDPAELRRQALQQALLQGAAGVLQGNNLGTGLASGLGNFASGYGTGRKNAMEEGILNYKMKQDADRQRKQQEATQGILASLQGMMPQGSPAPNTGIEVANLPAVPPTGGFDAAAEWVLGQEGGYVEDDAGAGPTNFGINSSANPGIDVKALSREGAKDIYKNKYWAAINGDSLPPATALVAFDTAVNNGISVAQQLLQRTGGDPLKMIEERRVLYADLASANPEKFGAYVDGWNKRMDDLTAQVGGGQPAAMPGVGATPPAAPQISAQDQALINAQIQAAMASDDPLPGLANVAKTIQDIRNKSAEPPKTRNRDVGDQTLFEEYQNGQWVEISRAPRWNPNKPGQNTMQLDLDGDGVPEFSIGSTDEAVTKKTQGALEEKLLNSGDQLARLQQIESLYKPEYLTIPKRLGMEWNVWKEKGGGSFGNLSPQDQEELTAFTDFKRTAVDNLNFSIKEVTGAAMSESEAKRIVQGLPDPGVGLFDGDSPTEFKAKLDSKMRDVKNAMARYNYARKNGLDPLKSGISISEMPSIIKKRGDELMGQLRKSKPGASAEQLKADVVAALKSEFGL